MEHIISIVSRKVGKRKAPAKPSQQRAKKEKKAKKDLNKPKRPPSAFFLFLFVSLSLKSSSNCSFDKII